MRKLESRLAGLERRQAGVRPRIIIVGIAIETGELKGYHCGNIYIARRVGEDESSVKKRAEEAAGDKEVVVVLREDRAVRLSGK